MNGKHVAENSHVQLGVAGDLDDRCKPTPLNVRVEAEQQLRREYAPTFKVGFEIHIFMDCYCP